MGKNTSDFDKDINPVLEISSNEELEFLVDLLKSKWSNFFDTEKTFKEHYPNHRLYADLIASHIRRFSGNSFANLGRGFSSSLGINAQPWIGPAYREIVYDVASKLKAPYNKKQDISTIEKSILFTFLNNTLEKMTESEKEKLFEALGGKRNLDLTGPLLTTAILTIFRCGGTKSFQIMLIVASSISKALLGRGLGIAAEAMLTRVASIITGPIGWTITGVWTLVDLLGPAYRVTLPCVVYIAMLRFKYNSEYCLKCNAMMTSEAKFCSECGTEKKVNSTDDKTSNADESKKAEEDATKTCEIKNDSIVSDKESTDEETKVMETEKESHPLDEKLNALDNSLASTVKVENEVNLTEDKVGEAEKITL